MSLSPDTGLGNGDAGASFMARGHAARKENRLYEAIEFYRTAVRLRPDLGEAFNGLGITLARLGQSDEAITAFRSAILVTPGYPEALNNLGNALDEKKLFSEAITAYRTALGHRPNYVRARLNLAATLIRAGRLNDAETELRSAVTMAPDNAEAFYTLGTVLRQKEKNEAAVEAFKTALNLRPNHPEAHNDLGDVYQELNRLQEAEASYRTAIAHNPNYAEAYNNLGVVLSNLNRKEEASTSLKKAIALRPDLGEAQGNLGALLILQGNGVEAEPLLRNAVDHWPDWFEAPLNLGSAFYLQRRYDEAEDIWRKALIKWPNAAEFHTALGEVLLMQGAYAEGWRELEWRWRLPDKTVWAPRDFPQPQWNGEPIEGRTILLHGEQGLGDIIQFVRYAQVIAALGATVIVEVYPPLERLMAMMPGVHGVAVRGRPLPPFDVHLPMMSAPYVIGTTVETIPPPVPYLDLDVAATARWNESLSSQRGLKVGLVWAGDPRKFDTRANSIDQRRSMRLSQFARLLEIPGVSFVSLQKGVAVGQLADLPASLRPFDVMEQISDFADTAALAANLDLVITVDTSVAHLVGTLGKPVWILSRFDGCWRWFLGRDDSPWYPTARLFRQEAPGDWDTVIARVAKALADHVAAIGADPR